MSDGNSTPTPTPDHPNNPNNLQVFHGEFPNPMVGGPPLPGPPKEPEPNTSILERLHYGTWGVQNGNIRCIENSEDVINSDDLIYHETQTLHVYNNNVTLNFGNTGFVMKNIRTTITDFERVSLIIGNNVVEVIYSELLPFYFNEYYRKSSKFSEIKKFLVKLPLEILRIITSYCCTTIPFYMTSDNVGIYNNLSQWHDKKLKFVRESTEPFQISVDLYKKKEQLVNEQINNGSTLNFVTYETQQSLIFNHPTKYFIATDENSENIIWVTKHEFSQIAKNLPDDLIDMIYETFLTKPTLELRINNSDNKVPIPFYYKFSNNSKTYYVFNLEPTVNFSRIDNMHFYLNDKKMVWPEQLFAINQNVGSYRGGFFGLKFAS